MLIILNFLLLFSIFGGSSYYNIYSLNELEPIKNYFLNSLKASFQIFFQMNGFFLSIVINNSLLNDREQSFLPTVLSYPVPRKQYFVTKVLIYFIVNLLINSLIVFLILLNNSMEFDVTLYFIIIISILINIFLATSVVLVVYFLIKGFFMSNLILFIFWSFFLSFVIPIIRGLNISLVITAFFDPTLLFNAYLENNLSGILFSFIFSFLMMMSSFYIALEKFNNREIF